MGQSIKFNKLLDTSGIVHKKNILKDKLLLPYILFENQNGTNGNINLNDDVANYKFIEIYGAIDNIFTSQKVYNASNKNVCIRHNYPVGTLIVDILSIYTIKGRSISPVISKCGYSAIGTNETCIFHKDNVNYFNVTMVVGYK